MLIKYRGKELNIKDKYAADFEKYNGFKINQNVIDSYIFLEYIGNKERESETRKVADRLSAEEIETTVKDYVLQILRAYMCDPSYE